MTAWSHRRRERLDGLEDLLFHAYGAAVLDVGCNRGLVGYEFANHGARLIHGCDISIAAIATARSLFADVLNCESRFEVVDLSKGPSAFALFGAMKYDMVLLLGVYHKLARKMSRSALDNLMGYLAQSTQGRFAWNGFAHEFAEIDSVFSPLGLDCVHRAEPRGQHVAIWQRE